MTVLGIVLVAVSLLGNNRSSVISRSTMPPPPTITPEPLIPTRTAASPTVVSATMAISVTRILTLSPTLPSATRVSPRQTPLVLYQGRPRWGVGVSHAAIGRYEIDGLKLGWYLNWQTALNPSRPGNVEYVQMVRLRKGVLEPDEASLASFARANPGTLWLMGNEPDVKWQDNVEPNLYARLYNQGYKAIKSADPSAQIAIGGISQPTPLRLRYLDAVLDSYRQQFGADMPIDVWNVHNFILREERGSWGVDIPPGMQEDHGILYEIDDSDNLIAFRKQIEDFRRWMADRGYRNSPLIVSEYGILMPEDYGFPQVRVTAFLKNTFEYFLTGEDPALGFPGDGNRLVQRWCWYSLDDTLYPTGRLFDPSTGKITETGKAWAGLVSNP